MIARRPFLIQLGRAAAAGVATASAGRAWSAATPGVSADAVTIGASVGLTGATAVGGQGHVAGIRAAFDEINRAGGIHGRMLRLDARDDAYDPKRSLQNVTAMVESGSVFALMSMVGTGSNLATNPMTEAAGVPVVGPITGAESLRRADQRFTFHVRPSYYDEVAYMVTQFVQMGHRDLAVVFLDNAFGKEILGYTKRAFAEAKVRALAEVSLAGDGKNAADCADQVLRSKAGAVILATTGAANTDFVLAVRSRGSSLPMVGLSLTFNDGQRLGKNTAGLASTLVFPPFKSDKYAIIRRFWASMHAAKQTSQANSAIESWWNAQVLAQGLRRAGRDLTRERFRAGLVGMRDFGMDELLVSFPDKAPYVGMKQVSLGVFSPDGILRT
ncbi:ABC transporter substrate-binding protein [Ramlibacter pallidus]|uniref:ABC transporter substrate-binding protein n=1 Tax=Ramlibacter pallidus TaxID=2780087 RepID=A0ABR9S6V2_9BURK|nr:ABC transporter substrate-binding protein [Ramlibacter pallidus]